METPINSPELTVWIGQDDTDGLRMKVSDLKMLADILTKDANQKGE